MDALLELGGGGGGARAGAKLFNGIPQHVESSVGGLSGD